MESDKKNERSVAILMGTFNGEKYLREQLDSINNQSLKNWRLYASDDGSSDGTISILETYQKYWGTDRLRITKGPQRGHAANFLSLVQDEEIQADYYAFCDQDDIWLEDKLERSIRSIQKFDESAPALYGSRTIYIDKDGKKIGISTLFRRPPSFKNALVQNIVGANTMVFNRAACLLLRKTPSQLDIVSHDWWAYMLVSGCDGRIFYDSYPSVRYRQHGNNIVGQNIKFLARFQRVKALLEGRFMKWNEINLNALNNMALYLPLKNRVVLSLFSRARCGSPFTRIYNLYRSGVYRQTFAGNLGLLLAAILRKL